MVEREACPQCGSRHYKRNGRIHTGKQNHKCKACGRAFVLVPENHVITEEQRAVIERLLLERISLRGICRVIGVGLRWLLSFMVERFTAAPDDLYIQPTAGTQRVILQRLEAEVDELWSFVGRKADRHWVWIAMDAETRQIIAFHVGDRSRQSAHALWEKLPREYQAQATFYTDCYEVYKGVIPPAQHRAITKLNQTTRDWHRATHADRSRVVRLLTPLARSDCAQNNDSGDFPDSASPDVGRSPPCPVWLSISLTPSAALCGPAESDGECGGVILFALHGLSRSARVSGRAVGRPSGGQRHREAYAPTPNAAIADATTVSTGDFAQRAPAVWVVSDPLELCHGGFGTLRATTDHRLG
jgi:insertion element IS1 protein InsB